MSRREEEVIVKIVFNRMMVRETRKCINQGETDPRMILYTIRKYVDMYADMKDVKKALRTLKENN